MESLSPFVFWSQTKQTLLLKVDLKDAKVCRKLISRVFSYAKNQ